MLLSPKGSFILQGNWNFLFSALHCKRVRLLLCSVRLKFIQIEREGFILVNNGISFLSIISSWPQEPITCQFRVVIIYIGFYGLYVRHYLTWTTYVIFLFQETLKELFPSWFDIKRHEEVVTFTCGLMQDPRPLVNYAYEMYIEMHQNQWRLAQWNRKCEFIVVAVMFYI